MLNFMISSGEKCEHSGTYGFLLWGNPYVPDFRILKFGDSGIWDFGCGSAIASERNPFTIATKPATLVTIPDNNAYNKY